MSQLTYLQMMNRVLSRNGKDTVSTVPTSGVGLLVADWINDAHTDLFNEENGQIYTLYTETTFATVANTATYSIPADFGKGILLVDETNDQPLCEDSIRSIGMIDADRSDTGQPTHYALEATVYRLYRIPAGVYTIRDMYFKMPAAMTAITDTSDLGEEWQNLVVMRAEYYLANYLQRYETADRVNRDYISMLKKAKSTNKKKIQKLRAFGDGMLRRRQPRLPSNYPAGY